MCFFLIENIDMILTLIHSGGATEGQKGAIAPLTFIYLLIY
jgi:hypothetical protein